MSEIFDFLRKTEVENRKRSSLAHSMSPAEPAERFEPMEPDVLVPEPESPEPESLSPGFEKVPVIQDPASIENGMVDSTKFDLLNASNQIRNVMDLQSIIGEQFRLLRTRLNLMQKQNGMKTLLITSTVPQEGKSFTSYGLAGIMAQEPGKRIAVIDADMRKTGSGRDMGLDASRADMGLAQVLQGKCEFQSALLESADPPFWFLPSGDLPSNPSELLSDPSFERLIKSAAESFDWVIVDSPPILALSDATLMAPMCHAVLLVVRANSTPVKLVNETINRIGRERICGVVLNRQKHTHSSRYYYQYYYGKSKPKKSEQPVQP